MLNINFLILSDATLFTIHAILIIIVMLAVSVIFSLKLNSLIDKGMEKAKKMVMQSSFVHYSAIEFLFMLKQIRSRLSISSQVGLHTILLRDNKNSSIWNSLLISKNERLAIEWLANKGYIDFEKKSSSRFEIKITKKGLQKVKIEKVKRFILGKMSADDFNVIYCKPFQTLDNVCKKKNYYYSTSKTSSAQLIV